jgi:hypothetical protein
MASPVLQFKRGNIGAAATIPALRPGEPAFTLDKFDLFVGLDTSVAGNKFFGSHRYWTRENGTNSLNLKLVDKDGTNYIAVKSPNTLGGNVTYVLPGTQGATSSVLTNDGSGNLTWASGSANPTFTGIATFSDTTDNTLGNPDTGAVQIDGGLGVNKNVTVGAGLSVVGQSYFIGTATFYGGTLNLGDSDTDDIVFGGEIKSNLIPTDDATYNLGTSTKRWNNASFAGIGTFTTGLVGDSVRLGIGGAGVVDTTSGSLYLDSSAGSTIVNDHLYVFGDLDVTGNISIGGTVITLRGEDVFIENKDIVLGYTTSITPNDDTANHAGVAIASTIGTPLVSFTAAGINTLPDTYKQLMWFKSGTLGFSTDAFAFNYGVAIGTTTMANGVRLAVGSGITMSDTEISATTFRGSLIGNVFASDIRVTGITTTGTLKLNGTPGIGITGISASTTLAENSNDYLPTQAAVKAYVDAVDVTLGLNADSGGPSTVSTAQTLTISGTTSEVETSVSGQTVTIGLPNDVIVGTSLSAPTVKTATIQHQNGTNAVTIDTGGNVTASQNLTVTGDLFVNGSTTQVNTSSITVEDRTIELGVVDGSAPSTTTTWDLGVLFNYYQSSAKKSAVIWEQSASRFVFGSEVSDGGGTDNNSPQITFSSYAPIEIGSLWVNDCAGQSQVISCTGTERYLNNITIDAGTF